MARNVKCQISGKTYVFAQDYFNKKIEEYGDLESLKKFFVTKRVKSLLDRGYGVVEIRNILSVDSKDLLDSDDPNLQEIVTYYKLKQTNNTKRPSSNFATHKTDDDVAIFINNIKTSNII